MNNYNGGGDFQKEMEKFKREFQNNSKLIIMGVAIFVLVVLGYTSFYTVEPDEEAVVIRFGRYVGTYPPGPHFKLPFGIDKVIKLQTRRVLQEEFGFRTRDSRTKVTTYDSGDYDKESLMVTGDLNVADVEWVVQYQISDPFKYLFQTSTPVTNIRDISESIMRRVVGDRTVAQVLTTGRKEIAIEAKELMHDVLNNKYDMGVNIVTVKLQDVNPPDMVKPSFNEVNEAKQDQETAINQAEKNYNQVIPEARGKAEKTVSEAEGYGDALVNRAKGDAEKFSAILKEYRRAPEVTRKRLYIEAMEGLFKSMEQITIVDPKIKGLLPVFEGMKMKGTK